LGWYFFFFQKKKQKALALRGSKLVDSIFQLQIANYGDMILLYLFKPRRANVFGSFFKKNRIDLFVVASQSQRFWFISGKEQYQSIN
jgi:hypothetical protein